MPCKLNFDQNFELEITLVLNFKLEITLVWNFELEITLNCGFLRFNCLK